MNLEEVEKLLSLYEKNPEELKEYLKKYQRKLNSKLRQQTFEKYITNTLPHNLEDRSIYGEYNGLFTFTNGVSFYQLTNPLIISKFVLQRNTRGKYSFSRKVDSEDFEEIFTKLRDGFGNTTLDEENLVEYFSTLGAEKEITIVENNTGKLSALFNSIELKTLDIFLGQGKVYLSRESKMIYSETEYGKAYILGR